MDFTLKIYTQLLKALQQQGFFFQTFEEFLQEQKPKSIVLRHDVDRLPENSLQTARIENELGIKGSYYFRAVPESWDERIIKEISGLRHEIGYHYENLTTCKGNFEKAIKDFELNLSKLRKLVPVKTICMHGSPFSKWDSKDLWQKYNYTDYGIIGEPYFDVNFNEVFYLTDTGRRWNGNKVSVRDKVVNNEQFTMNNFRNTQNIIQAANTGNLPSQIMFTIHPQRWTNNHVLWAKELVMQNIKNVVKRLFFVK